MKMKFKKLLHGYMNPSQQGTVIRLPNYLFTHDVWQFVKIKNTISKEPSNRNMIVSTHIGAKEGVWIEHDENF